MQAEVRISDYTLAGVVFEERNDLSEGVKWLNVSRNTSHSADIVAMILASLKCGISSLLTMFIRSGSLLELLITDLPKMEDEGFHRTHNAGLLQTLLGCLRMHKTSIRLYMMHRKNQ